MSDTVINIMTTFGTTLSLLLLTGVLGLRDVQVTVPEAAVVGDTVTLACRYELEGDTLYSVKWYKGRQEFFRYIPKELPHTRVFALEGAEIDVGRSGPAGVVLRNVTTMVSGRYRCEVSADSPSFHTAMKTSYMHVVELPVAAPTITADKSRVTVGDTLRVRCTAPPAHPPANLTWHLNDNPIKGTDLDYDPPFSSSEPQQQRQQKPTVSAAYRSYTANESTPITPTGSSRSKKNVAEIELTDTSDEGLKASAGSKVDREPVIKRSSGSSLVLHIKQDSFQQGRLVLTCRATVFSVYKAQAHLRLEGEKPQIASVLGTRESSSGGTGPVKRVSLLICLSLLYLSNALR